MRKVLWICFIATLFIAPAIITTNAKITLDTIQIETPKKKTGGVVTEVKFDHKKHAQERAKDCESCHPALKEVFNAAENNKVNVHKTCKQCHAKDKLAKTFKCSSCHTPVK